jgi:hypothetical protein
MLLQVDLDLNRQSGAAFFPKSRKTLGMPWGHTEHFLLCGQRRIPAHQFRDVGRFHRSLDRKAMQPNHGAVEGLVDFKSSGGMVSGPYRSAREQSGYNALSERHDGMKAKLDTIAAEIRNRQAKQAAIDQFITGLIWQPTQIDKFDVMCWSTMVDYATVYSKNDVRFTFKGGTTIQA